jgi:DNA-binding transcriptional ArsR family regulator/SAM-dependent methyltransferase
MSRAATVTPAAVDAAAATATPAACCAPLAAPALSASEAAATAALFRALADPHRVRIVNLLATSPDPVCVCELVAPLGLSQPTVSHHLKKLVGAGLLRREQRGQWAYYALDRQAMARLAAITSFDPASAAAGGPPMSQPTTEARDPRDAATLRAQVRAHYAAAARRASAGTQGTGSDADSGGDCGQPAGCGCPSACCGDAGAVQSAFGAGLYTVGEQGVLPEAALRASLGCGNPTAVADLREGETVLDLGSGGGIDVLLSARRVGPSGHVYGLDMTEEMLALARRNAAEAGAGNVTFLKGHIEEIPLPEATVDVVISNCVINLSTDKPAVFREVYRVLKPGGRIGISDVVVEDSLRPADRAARGSYVGCIAGALSKAEYEQGLAAAGFTEVSVRFSHQVADGLHGAIINATKPAAPPRPHAA